MKKSTLRNALTITPEGAHAVQLLKLEKYEPSLTGDAENKPAVVLTMKVLTTGKIETVFLNLERKDGKPSIFDRTIFDIDEQIGIADDFDTDDIIFLNEYIKNRECMAYAVHNTASAEIGLKTYCNFYFNTNAPKVQAMLAMRQKGVYKL